MRWVSVPCAAVVGPRFWVGVGHTFLEPTAAPGHGMSIRPTPKTLKTVLLKMRRRTRAGVIVVPPGAYTPRTRNKVSGCKTRKNL